MHIANHMRMPARFNGQFAGFDFQILRFLPKVRREQIALADPSRYARFGANLHFVPKSRKYLQTVTEIRHRDLLAHLRRGAPNDHLPVCRIASLERRFFAVASKIQHTADHQKQTDSKRQLANQAHDRIARGVACLARLCLTPGPVQQVFKIVGANHALRLPVIASGFILWATKDSTLTLGRISF